LITQHFFTCGDNLHVVIARPRASLVWP